MLKVGNIFEIFDIGSVWFLLTGKYAAVKKLSSKRVYIIKYVFSVELSSFRSCK